MSEEPIKPSKIKNKLYREFLDGSLIRTIRRPDIDKVLQNVKHRHSNQARLLVIAMWMTGARPNEVLALKAQDIRRSGEFIEIHLKGSKGGRARSLPVPADDPYMMQILEYSERLPPPMFLFWAFRSKKIRHGVKRTFINKSGERITKHYTKEYPDTAARLPYWFAKWFRPIHADGVPPYYLRHNRMSISAEDLNPSELMLLKGSKSLESVTPYLHLSKETGQRVGRTLSK